MKKNIFHCAPLVCFSLVAVLILAPSQTPGQTRASYGQQIAAMKILSPNLSVLGVMGSTLSEKDVQDITRAGMGQGVQIIAGRPKNAREISTIYKIMVSDKKIQLLWIPQAGDDLMLGVGFEFLRSNSIPDKIGLCVPSASLLQSGALCSVSMENGKLTTFVNQKIADLLGTKVPKEETSSISYVSR